LSIFADSYPPNIESAEEMKNVIELFRQIETLLLDYSDELKNPDPLVEFRLGELYRMGHNLDIESSWNKSEKHLKKAIKLNPKDYEAYNILGLLYVNSGYPQQAEKVFLKAIDLSKPNHNLTAYSGLAFSYYYQGKRDEAIQMINQCLQIEPDNKYYISLLNAFQAKGKTK